MRWYSSKQLMQPLPPGLKSWLFDRGSLTQKLTSHCCEQRFHVELLRQEYAAPLYHEQQILPLTSPRSALVREVFLCCDGEPLVFARTLIPVNAYRGPLRFLSQLYDRPLGELLFTTPSVRRSSITVTRTNNRHLPSRHVNLGKATCWGRRSVFHLIEQPLLVQEFFLPAFLARELK